MKTEDSEYLSKAEEAASNFNIQKDETKVEYKWGHNWDDMHYVAQILLARATGNQNYIASIERNLDYWLPDGGIAYTPGGLAWLDSWGSCRYSANVAFLASIWAKDPLCTSEKRDSYISFAENQINYILGDNPDSRSYIIGYGNNSPEYPHHRTAHGTWTCKIEEPTETRHVLYGALVGGPDQSGAWTDSRTDYISNEVACDYNSGLVGILAHMVGENDGTTLDDFPQNYFRPKNERLDDLPALTLLGYQPPGMTSITVRLQNRAGWPARFTNDLAYRYYIDISEAITNGYSIDDITASISETEETATLSGPFLWENDIYYYEIKILGLNLYPGMQTGSSYSTSFKVGMTNGDDLAWDPSNDWSYQGLSGTEEAAENIPVYDNGIINSGQEPSQTNPTSVPLTPSPIIYENIDDYNYKIKIYWGENKEGNVLTYRVYCGETEGFIPSDSNLILETEGLCAILNQDDTRSYYYKITALDSYGVESISTEAIYEPVIDISLVSPDAPEEFTATVLQGSKAFLDWTSSPIYTDLAEYRIYRDSISGFEPSTDNLVGKTGVGWFLDCNLPIGLHYYKVNVFDCSGQNSPNFSVEIEVNITENNEIPEIQPYIDYRCGNAILETESIKPQLQIVNNGTNTIVLSNLTVRYWFTSEASLSDISINFDYVAMGNDVTIGSFGEINDTHYFEFTFLETTTVPTYLGGDGSSNSLLGSASTGDIQIRLSEIDNQAVFNQEDDYSFDASASSYISSEYITIYYSNALVWGIEPYSVPVNDVPNIIDPLDVEYVENQVGNSISWSATDDNPDLYSILLNGEEIETGTWISGSEITISIDGLDVGIYEYICTVYDTDGISASSSVSVTVSSSTSWDYGDVNHDRSVTIVDALLVAQYYVGVPVSIDTELADVNVDGAINIVDALLIAQYYVGEIPTLP